MAEGYEAIVIGTGFGGAISAARLSKKWPGRVLVLERGKRYPMGSFPRSPHDTARNFWNVPVEGRRRPKSRLLALMGFGIHGGHIMADPLTDRGLSGVQAGGGAGSTFVIGTIVGLGFYVVALILTRSRVSKCAA